MCIYWLWQIQYLEQSLVGDKLFILSQLLQDRIGNLWRRIASVCSITTVNETVIREAIESNFKDFEDAIQYQTAVNARLDTVVTRNPKDYIDSSIAIFTPVRFLQLLEQS